MEDLLEYDELELPVVKLMHFINPESQALARALEKDMVDTLTRGGVSIPESTGEDMEAMMDYGALTLMALWVYENPDQHQVSLMARILEIENQGGE